MNQTCKASIIILNLLGWGISLFAVPGYSDNSAADYRVKVAYIYQFARFIRWSGLKGNDKGAPFVICAVGDDGVVDYLPILNKRKVGSRQVQVIRITSIAQGHQCHIVYISKKNETLTPKELRVLRDKPVLTVSSEAKFIDKEGIIGFVLDKNKVRLEINIGAARRAGLEVSAKLLEVCIRRVSGSKKGDGL